MADEEAPSWLQENPIARGSASSSSSTPAAPKKSGFFGSSSTSTPPPVPPVQTSQQTIIVKAAEPDPPYKWLARLSVTIICMGVSIFVAATGALGVNQSSSVSDTGVIFVGVYLVMFAAILFAYECVQVCPIQSFDIIMKRNFGFLYGPNGKGIYMIFMGVLAFGLSTPRNLAIACGVVTAFFGVLLALLNLYRPQYFDKKEKYIP